MLLQTNSYVVPREKRVEHARLLRRFRQALLRLGCDHFEVFEQVGANWSSADTTGRFVQIMRFRDRKHQLAVQAAERNDPTTRALLQEFCDLINFQYQQQQGLFAVGYYTSFLRMPSQAMAAPPAATEEAPVATEEAPAATEEAPAATEEAPPATEEAPPPLEAFAAESDTNGNPEPEEAAIPSLVIPEPEPENETEPEPASTGADDLSADDQPGDIDFNADSPSALQDDSDEPTGHDAFSSLPDGDLPESGDSVESSDVVPQDADSNGDAEAQNPTTPSNS
ncbi:MAG TPA: hypothetical protein VHX86_13425 [Tepidisphaeraceae bacterium]|jgi:hypothetical protein|nr:hypothetical protein [Tepidisphaeraceae bacterium]